MKKRIISVVLASICSLSLMGCESNITDSFRTAIGDKGTNDVIEATVITHPVEAVQDGNVYATGSYCEVILSDECAKKYPNLKSTLDDYNESWKSSAESNVAEYGYYAQEYPDDVDVPYEDNTTVQIVRSDGRLFSLFCTCDSYSGGAHPNHYVFSINLDANTGNYMDLSKVITDKKKLPEAIEKKTYEKYPDNKEEIETYYVCNCATEGNVFEDKMEFDTYTWTLTDEGIHIYFSPYEIASYATGDMDVVVTEEDIPGIIQENYKLNAAQDLDSIITYETAETIQVEPTEVDYGESDYEDEYSNAVSIDNPTWDRYVSEDAGAAAENHITLTETSKETTDWLDTEVWATKNGFESPFLSYGDENYYYAPGDGGDYGYEYTTLFLYDKETNDLLHTYDLDVLCNGPDEKTEDFSHTRQYIHWAKAMNGILYVSLGHNGYASEEPWSSYMVAIDMAKDKVLWRSEPQVSNANNFQIVDDTIICGYGFTEEPDYLYLLDKNTGEKIDQIPLVTGPSQIEVVGDTLYVATYNTAYTFKINK